MAIPQEVLAYGWIPFTVVVVVSNTSAIESFWAKLAANFVHWTLLCLLSLARKTNETLRPAWLQVLCHMLLLEVRGFMEDKC